MYSSRFFVTLATPKLLSFDNKNEFIFLSFCIVLT